MIYFFLASPKHAADETGPLVFQVEGRELQIRAWKGPQRQEDLAFITDRPAALEAALALLAERKYPTLGGSVANSTLMAVLRSACKWHTVTPFDPVEHFTKEES